MDNAMSISAAGMQAASARLDAAASNVVTANGQGPAPATGNSVTSSFPLAYDPAAPYANLPSQVDLPAQLVNFKEAANDFRASLLAYKTSSQMFKTLLDATA